MELLLLLIIAGVIGYFYGKSRSKSSPPASQQVVDVQAKEAPEEEKQDA